MNYEILLYNKEKDTIKYCPTGKTGTVNIPESVVTIGNCAFFNSKVENIIIPKGVTKIENSAFFGCTNLKSLNIPESVTEMNGGNMYGISDIFGYSNSLEEINVDENNANYASENGLLYSKDKKSLLCCPAGKTGIVDIPDTVIEVADGAFSSCKKLTRIIIPYGVSTIGKCVFSDGLKSVGIPKSITSKLDMVFSSCTTLKDVYYEGSEEEWKLLLIEEEDVLVLPEGVVVHYNSDLTNLPEEPETPSEGENTPPTSGENTQNPTNNTTPTSPEDNTQVTPSTGDNTQITSPTDNPSKDETAPVEITDVQLAKSKVTYNGKSQTPAVVAKDAQGNVIGAENYDVTYANNKKVGQATVTVTFKGNYKGTVTKTFTINPKGTTISKISAKKKGFSVKWKKQNKETTGYEIQYSTSKKFKSAKIAKIGKNKTTSKSISKLKSKKKYYVRIRTYKTVKVNGKSTKLYSGWSGAKSVKTKK